MARSHYPTPVGIRLGITASAILYPTPVGIPLGIAASAILSTGDYRTGDYRVAFAIRLSLRLKRKTSGLSECEPLRFLTPYRLRSLTQIPLSCSLSQDTSSG